jgi:uncharacterized membrane protein YdbT with pleckstrin-like domain
MKIKCDVAYLKKVLVLQILFFSLLFISLTNGQTPDNILAFLIATIGILFSLFQYWKKTTYKFAITDDFIETNMLFTKHLDVRIPISKIQGISTQEGIVEAILNVGQIKISTASSNNDHQEIIWPHLSNHEEIAKKLQQLMSK